MAVGRLTAVVLCDGEHYPNVVAAAIDELRLELDVVAGVLLGGTEKLRAIPLASDYGLTELAIGTEQGAVLSEVLRRTGADLVVDLSDEPVVSQRTRLALAAVALASGAGYRAGGLTLAAPRRDPYPGPSIAVVGTGKRVGKTAISGHLGRRARDVHGLDPTVVVAMGRGGPATPELVDPRAGPLGVAELLVRSRAGAHAASDFLEDAVLAGLPAIGCRRCGAGLAGDVVHSTVAAGAALAATLAPALTIFEGSGASQPPVACDATVLVASDRTPVEELAGYLGPYRLLCADLLVIVGDGPSDRLREAVAEVRPGLAVLTATLEPRPSSVIAGRRVAVFTTAPAAVGVRIGAALGDRHGAEVVAISGSLADREVLRSELARIDADVFCTELKAAAIDVVAEEAARRGVELVLLGNEPVSPELDDALDGLIRRVCPA